MNPEELKEMKEGWQQAMKTVQDCIVNYIEESTKPSTRLNVEVVPAMARVLLDMKHYWS